MGWAKPQLTMTMSSAVVVSAICAPMAGKLVDKGHGRMLLTSTAGIGVVLLLVLSQVESFALFSATWIALGFVMSGCLYEPCFAYLTRTRGDNARRAITLVTLVAGFAGTVSFPINNFIATTAGWRISVLVFAALIAFIAVPLFWLGTRSRGITKDSGGSSQTDTNPTRGSALQRAMSTPVFWLLAVAFSFMYLNHSTVIMHLLPILEERGVELSFAVLVISLIGPMQVAGRLLLMTVEQWVSIHLAAILSFGCVCASAVCLAFGGSHAGILIAMVALQGTGIGLSSITRPVVTAELLGRTSFGVISGAIALPVMMSTALSPSIAAWVWDAYGYKVVTLVNITFAAVALACFVAAMTLGLRTRRAQDPG
jgi:MFS family permease